jgi:hypothetical protein
MSEEFAFVARIFPDILRRLQEAILNLENAKRTEQETKDYCRLLRNSNPINLTLEQENELHNRIHIQIQRRIISENELEQLRNEFRSISRELLICSEIL